MKGCILNAFKHLKLKIVIFFIKLHLIYLEYYINCHNTQHWFTGIFAGQKLISFISYQGTNIIYLNIYILRKKFYWKVQFQNICLVWKINFSFSLSIYLCVPELV